MFKKITSTFVFISFVFNFGFTSYLSDADVSKDKDDSWNQYVYSLYDCLDDTSLNQLAFDYGLRGYYTLKREGKLINDQLLTIVDFSQHSSKKRMYVIDMESVTVLYKTYCTHGKNTGKAIAEHFSNKSGSHQSSLGFYLTRETYSGKFDYAMRLDGLETTNNKARQRGIVVHGAEYATERFLKTNQNVLGRSYGCPAVPKAEAKTVIDLIKGGACLYIHAADPAYKNNSSYLNPARLPSTIDQLGKV